MNRSPAKVLDPRERLQAAPMSRLQKLAVFVTVAISALDGFDVLAVTLAAPSLSTEWGLTKFALGLVLSAGLVGMTLGSLFIAPLADIVGRRKMIFSCLGLMGGGMAMGALSGDAVMLSISRVLTGAGVGAMVPVINPLATEFANARWRDLAVSLMAVGFPIGGVVGGVAGTFLLQQYDWRLLFWIGAALSLVMLPLVWFWLPEPLSFLIERPTAGSLTAANRLLQACGQAAVSALPAPRVSSGRQRMSLLFRPDHIGTTLKVMVLNLMVVVAAYFVMSWAPQLVADQGFTPAQAASVALILNVTGIFGGLCFGLASAWWPMRQVALVSLLGFASLIVIFFRLPGDLEILRAVAAILGFFFTASACAVHSVVSRSFDDHVRASGAGLIFGVGRAGSAIAPLVAGWLLGAGVGRETISGGIAAGVLIAAILVMLLATLREAKRQLAPLAATTP